MRNYLKFIIFWEKMIKRSFCIHIFMLFFFTLIYLLIDFIIYKPFYIVTLSLCFLNVVLFLFNPKKSIFMFLPFMLLSDWASKFDIRSTAEMASINTIYFGPFNLMTYMLLFFTLFSIVNVMINKQNKLTVTKIGLGVVVIFLIYILEATIGLKNILSYPREYIGDIASFINLFAGFIIINTFIKDTKSIDSLIWVFLYTFGARTLVGLIMFFFNIGYKGGYLLIPFYDPIGAFPIFVLFLCISFILFGNIHKHTRSFFYLLMLMSLAFMMMWPGKSNWIFTFFGLVFVSLFLHFGKKLIFLMSTFLVIIIMVLTLYNFKKDLILYSLWRLSTLCNITEDAESSSSSQRYTEYMNIFYKLKDENSLFYGDGAGGWFDDKYIPFSAIKAGLMHSAFTEKQVQEWKFFHPHENLSNIFLKSGLIGLAFFGYAIILFTEVVFKKGKGKDKYQKAIFIGLYVPILTLLIGGFASKNFIMAGVLLGLMENIQKQQFYVNN